MFCVVGKLAGRGLGSTLSQPAAAQHDFVLAQGTGWELGYDRKSHNPGTYSALVGGDHWSIALSKYEYDDFVKVHFSAISGT